MKRRNFWVTMLVAPALACCGRGGNGGDTEGKLRVVATTGMIADVARNIGGEQVDVYGIIGEGVDPHLYKPTSHDVKKLQSADVVFYNGLKLEGKMGDILEKIGKAGRPVRAVTEAITSVAADDGTGHEDPHVWMDPALWAETSTVIADSLSSADPENEPGYRAAAANYGARLVELHSYASGVMATVPEERRVLVTAHDAFNYFARAFGLEVRGIQGISTESEAGVRDIERLVSYLVEKEIPAVFVETSVSDKNVRTLIEGANAKGHKVIIGGSLFSDAMGAEGTYEGTYIGMIDSNVTTIVRALGGEAPERGFQGKLTLSK